MFVFEVIKVVINQKLTYIAVGSAISECKCIFDMECCRNELLLLTELVDVS